MNGQTLRAARLAAFVLALVAGSCSRSPQAISIAFRAPRTFPVGVDAFDLVQGDMNGDGAPDLVIVNRANPSIGVLLQIGGDALFAEQRIEPVTVKIKLPESGP